MATPLQNIRLPATAAQVTPPYPQQRENSFLVHIDDRVLYTLAADVFTCKLCHATTSVLDNMKRHLHHFHEITLNPVQHRVAVVSLTTLLPVLPPEKPRMVPIRPVLRFEDMISDFWCDDSDTIKLSKEPSRAKSMKRVSSSANPTAKRPG